MANQLSEPPLQDSIIELDENRKDRSQPFFVAKSWIHWLQDSLVTRVQATPETRKVVRLSGQHAAIPTTAIPVASLRAGVYRVSYYARVTSIDGVSSSLTVSLRWTEGAVPLVLSGAALAGDTVSVPQSGSLVVEIDNASAVSYSTAYASNTPGKMIYRLSVALEQLG